VPYEVRSVNGEYCVFKKGTDKKFGCHPTVSKAKRQLRALYANERSSMKALREVKATVIDDDAFRLLAIPYDGPIPSPKTSRGVDLDGEWFSPNTDIKPDWFTSRVVDWHHGFDPTLGRTVLGKATDLEEDEDGWWITVWLKHGEKRVDLIRKLAERGAQLYGSSESVHGMVKKADTGEILQWPYIRQTLSTSPQNTYSVLRPIKAVLGDRADGSEPTGAFFDDLTRYLDDLMAEPSADLSGDADAKAGRVLAARNEARLRDGIEVLEREGWHPLRRKLALERFREILEELEEILTPI